MIVVGLLFGILTKSWVIGLTLAILAGIADTLYRSRTAAEHVNGASQSGAQRRTRWQLRKMRRAGYFALDARPIPGSREYIDHLVVGPTGVYAIDSEKWNPKVPVRTLNGKRLYRGPESQKERLEHAVWEAGQASEILSAALGTEIAVRPALAIYGPRIPWDIATIRGVDVFTGKTLRKYLKRRGRQRDGVPKLTREEVRTIYETAARMLPDVAPDEDGRACRLNSSCLSDEGSSAMPPLRSRTVTHGRNMAGARALLRATGVASEDFGKPIIAVANSFTEFVPGHVHLADVGRVIADAVRAAGAIPREFNTIAVDDGIAMGHGGMLYSLPSRELIADSVEYMVNAHCADALICVSNCDKITPGMLIAAMRLNIPTVFVSGGPMEAGKVIAKTEISNGPVTSPGSASWT